MLRLNTGHVLFSSGCTDGVTSLTETKPLDTVFNC
jgi:hypothetical protein